MELTLRHVGRRVDNKGNRNVKYTVMLVGLHHVHLRVCTNVGDWLAHLPFRVSCEHLT